jgi:hypothetical protein
LLAVAAVEDDGAGAGCLHGRRALSATESVAPDGAVEEVGRAAEAAADGRAVAADSVAAALRGAGDDRELALELCK